MKFKIGVFGSAAGETEDMKSKAQALGEALAGRDCILITGACTGLPYDVVSTAHARNSAQELWGYSPAYEYEEQLSLTAGNDSTIYTKLMYTPHEFPLEDLSARRKYRNILSTAACDAGIVVSGRWGTMNEFTNLYDMGKVIGVLTGTGGVADGLAGLHRNIQKPSKAVVIFESNPEKLVDTIITKIKRRQS